MEWITVREAAVRLQVRRDTVYRWLRSGKLQGRQWGRTWRVRWPQREED